MTILYRLLAVIDLFFLLNLHALYLKPLQNIKLLSNRLSLLASKSDLYDTAIPNLVKLRTNSSKAHVNKYNQFSKKQRDPLLIKILNVGNTSNTHSANNIVKNRGKTVPFIQPLSVSALVNKSYSIKNYRNASISSSSVSVKTQNATSRDALVKPKKNLGIKFKSVEPSDPYSFGYSELGCILNAHGIRGEVKLQSSTDISTIEDLQLVTGSMLYVKKPNRRTPRPIQLKSIRRQNNDIFLLSLENVDSRDMAESFKGYHVYIRKSDRPKLNSDEYRIRDLVGMKCYIYATAPFMNGTDDITELSVEHYLDNSLPVGVVEGIVPPDELCSPEMAKLMHSLFEIRMFPSEYNGTTGFKEIDVTDTIQVDSDVMCLVPFVSAIVKIVDNERRMLVFDPPKGLLDLTYREKKKYVIRGYLPSEITTLSSELRNELTMSTTLIPSLPSFVGDVILGGIMHCNTQ